MPAVDQDRELDRLRAAEVDQRVHRRADGAAGEEHVVDQQDAATLDGEGDVGALDARRLQAAVEIVAIEGDVDDAEGDQRAALDLLQRRGAAAAPRCTPRERMPMSARPSAPRLRSTTSCAIRASARWMDWPSITWRVPFRSRTHAPMVGTGGEKKASAAGPGGVRRVAARGPCRTACDRESSRNPS